VKSFLFRIYNLFNSCIFFPTVVLCSYLSVSGLHRGLLKYNLCLFVSFIAELEFVQIIIIVVVMMVMVVVITCLLNHYKLSARSFINRPSQGRRREENLSSVRRLRGKLRPGGPDPAHSAVLSGPRSRKSGGFSCSPRRLRELRDPEQQMELNRESVRAPPNRTIFDSDLIDSSVYGGPCPPSSNSGISATCYGSNSRMEGPPPTYNEVIGHFPGSTFYQHQQNNNGVPSFPSPSPISNLESTTMWNKEKDKQKGHPF
uniref:Prostate transmembrane protein, androgen induced 1 n=1 Tax=Naja naja TaxID=35670 RepID=A0A8C6VF28_NAJNA